MIPGARNHGLHTLQLQRTQLGERGVIRHAGGMAVGSAGFKNRIHLHSFRPMENGGCLVVLSLAYSLQDERDGNQSGAPASGKREPTSDGERILVWRTGT